MNLTDWLYSLPPSPTLLLLTIMTIALVESLAIIGIIVPGVIMLSVAASLAGHQELSVWLVLAAGVTGAFLGDNLSFWLGRTQRERIPRVWPFRRHPQWLERGNAFFQRHGIASVVIARFIGPVRPIVPMVVGMLHMPTQRFVTFNLLSALAWAPIYVLPGYLVGSAWDDLMRLPPEAERWLLTLTLSLVVLAVLFSWFRYQLGREGRLHGWLDQRMRHHPSLAATWNAFCSPAPDSSFPLASLSLLLTTLIALTGWTVWVLSHADPLLMDQQIHALASMLKQRWLLDISQMLAQIGDALGIGVLMAPWLIWLIWQRRYAALIHLTGALGVVAVGNTLFKSLAGRARPDTPDYLSGSMSYPSAHTSTIVVVVGLTAAFAAQAMPRNYRAYAYWAGIVVCTPMALSRLVLGVHWTSDLIGGALFGLVICALTRISYQRYQRLDRAMPPWVWLGAASLILETARVLLAPPV